MITGRTEAPATGRLLRVVERVLQIHRGERSAVRWTAALFAASQASQGLGVNTADTLFFLRFGVEFLPTMILLSGPVVMAGILGYSVGLGRLGPRRWLPMALLGSGGLLVLERIGITVGLRGIFPIVWLMGQVVMMLSLTVMWTAAAEVCTTRQAKRLYPLFAAAGIVGGVVGNSVTGPLARALGTENLLLVQTGLLVVAAALSVGLGRRYFRTRRPSPDDSLIADFRVGLALTRGSRLLRIVAWTGVAFGALLFLVIFPFSEVVTESFDSEADVAGFLGFFSAAATAATFVVSLFLTNRFFSRFGIVATLVAVPMIYVGGFSLWLASFGLFTATLIRGLQFVAVNAIGATAWSSLFNVLSARRRGQVMAFMVAGPMQLGAVISGVILLASAGLPSEATFSVALVVALGALALVWRMRTAYGGALVDAVKEGLVGRFTAPTAGIQKPVLDADTFRAISACLYDPRPEARAMAVAMLSRLDDEEADQLIREALQDDEARVRSAALEGLAARQGAWRSHGQALLSDPAPEIRRRTVELIWESRDSSGLSVESALADPTPAVRAMAAVVVGGGSGRDTVARLVDSSEVESIEAGLGAISLRPDLSGGDLSRFLGYPDRRVRAAAASALAERPGHAVRVRPLLDDPSIVTRRSAAAALANTDEGRSILLSVLEDGSVRASDAALRALTESGRGGADLSWWASQEITRASYLRRHRLALERGTNPTRVADYLIRLLKTREERLEGWAVLALSTRETRSAMGTVIKGIWSEDDETRSRAMEALDSMDHRAVVRDLLGLLEADVAEGTLGVRESLRELVSDLDYWVRALAYRCLGEELMRDLAQVAEAAERDPSPLVRSVLSRWEVDLMHETETLDLVQQVLALQRVPIFAGIDAEDLERIARVTTERHYEPDEVIFREGDEGDDMLLIIRGEVAVSRETDGESVFIRTLGEGEHVGELALLLGRPRISDVTAGPDGVQTLALRSRELQAILEERPEVAMAMLGTLAQRLATM